LYFYFILLFLDLLDSDAMAAEETRMRKAIHNVAEASIVIKVSQLFLLTEKVFRAILAENSFSVISFQFDVIGMIGCAIFRTSLLQSTYNDALWKICLSIDCESTGCGWTGHIGHWCHQSLQCSGGPHSAEGSRRGTMSLRGSYCGQVPSEFPLHLLNISNLLHHPE